LVLERVNCPEDLKVLSRAEVAALCDEIRDLIEEVVSSNGGHLASNLGVVELTVALHRSFDFSRDVLIWDVSHQCYAHKILTGRKERFRTLRRKGGISGFCRPDESPYDHFAAGHSSTSISAALGFAKARDLKGESHHVVAVIGDGALLNGLALEGLNNVDVVKSKVIIVLNDNGMSISPRVGGFANLLARLSSSPTYIGFKQFTRAALKGLPRGEDLIGAISRFKRSVKHLLLPTSFFEEMGLSYWGPFDGHDVEELERAFEAAKLYPRSLLIHVKTCKGKGCERAEVDPVRYHGVSPSGSRFRSFSDVFGEIAVRLGRERPEVVALTAAMCDGTGLSAFARAFPDRFFDVGIAESHMLTFAAGMARCGLRPIVAVYSTFLQRGYDQAIHDIALQRLPVVLAVDRAGIVGEDGPTHHGAFDIAYMMPVPNFVLMAPRDAATMERMFELALSLSCPSLIRYPRAEAPGLFPEGSEPKVELGRAQLILPGEEVLFLAYGSMVVEAYGAATILRERGVSAGVLDLMFAKPMDEEAILELGSRAKLLVVAEEGSVLGGVGQRIRALLHEAGICVPCLSLGIPDGFVEHGSRAELLSELGLDAPSMAELTLARLCLGRASVA